MSKLILQTDFCIIGGGLAGVCAAISAARNGASVVLVQDRSVLGGNASSEVKMHIVGADCHGKRPGARETGLIEEFKLEDAYRNPQRCFSLWDALLYEKVKELPNITLLLDSHCDGCTTEERDGKLHITAAHVNRNITEERFVINARYFADCSGDGRLGAEAGADFFMGREGRAEYNESLAQEEQDSQTLGNSILFTARDHGTPQHFVAPSWARRFEKHEFKFRPIHGYEYGYWWAEWGGQLNTIKDIEEIRHELLRIVFGIWDYVKNSGEHPDAVNYALDWFGALPGKRESRRFRGPYLLTENDIMSGRTFDDQVAYGGWWLDLHPPSGIDAIDEAPCVQHHIPHLYGIPLRALYSRNVANLFFAGRNISATHVAFASTRVMGTTAVMGQAIGTAAARLLREQGDSIAEAATPEVVRAIQQDLLRDDAFLLGITKDDSKDLTNGAACCASSEREGHPASRVLTGLTRDTHTHWGSWAHGDTAHGWESTTLPATLDVHLAKRALVREVHLTFDSGLQRELTLSPSNHVTRQTIRGPQPEIVRDYNLYLDETLVLSVRDNYLRKRVHRLPEGVETGRIRIEAIATHGSGRARIFEIRAY